jgi:two-component system sensor histidine kinase PilS (NtrC family)
MTLAWRVLALVNLFRLLVPILFAVLHATIGVATVGQAHPLLFAAVALFYFLFATVSIIAIRRHALDLRLQALISVTVDIVVIALLTYASGGMNSGLAVLLVLPVGALGLIVGLRWAMAFAAMAAIALLVQQSLLVGTGQDDIGELAAAGIVGALIFLVTIGIEPLARSLRESEELVRQREVDIANLAELNEFIVRHLRESILVVDAQDRIRLINDSAARLLRGGEVQPGTLLGEVSPRLLYLLHTWRRQTPDWHVQTQSLVGAGGAAMLQPHFVALERTNPGPTLIFLEDTSALAERVQQSKLAALGRLSASIAHEIRNPVGAMSHAAQLLRESPNLSPQDRRLTDIITSNSERISTIIENVLQLSRRESTRAENIDLHLWLHGFLAELNETLQLPEGRVRLSSDAEPIEVRIDPSHLHQLLWNLCENAVKYGHTEGGDDTIEIHTGRIRATNRPYLEVRDRGPGIQGADVDKIFEPFFTGGQGGTGLGLFIARELAQCNGAVLAYEPREGGGSVFRLVFADPLRWQA